MSKINENKEVLSFMIYMWNTWSFKECMTVFNGDDNDPYDIAHHIWDKYMHISNKVGCLNAPSQMVAELDENNLNKLIFRACELYNGRANRK